jgi:hypothetical protein
MVAHLTLEDAEAEIMGALLLELNKREKLGDVRIVEDGDPVLHGACVLHPGMDISADNRFVYMEDYPIGFQKVSVDKELPYIIRMLASYVTQICWRPNDSVLDSLAISWNAETPKNGMNCARIYVAPNV